MTIKMESFQAHGAQQRLGQACFFFLGRLFRRGLWASELELRLLLWSARALEEAPFFDGPLQLCDVLLDVDGFAFPEEGRPLDEPDGLDCP
ncbi:unnamed protein product [Spirodela intermedia]|uniref:Uncharacterized protein n=1 Tax=Spirodela intermedia TaxID=51605 RepID=A0A7I8JAP3_SPIIN|nr:unnamed protein product [Spirodela intermedia]CAA6667276.1 unnamed protein product [Spirodela intermedia]